MGRAIEVINKLNAVSFNWKESGERDISLIAEDVEKVIPEAVFYNSEGQIEGLKIMPLIAVIIEAVKELNKEKQNG